MSGDKPSREDFYKKQLGEEGFKAMQVRLRKERMTAFFRIGVLWLVLGLGYYLYNTLF